MSNYFSIYFYVSDLFDITLLTLVITIWDKPYRNITERYDHHEYDIWHAVGYFRAFCELQLTHAPVKHDFQKMVPPNFLPPNFFLKNFRNHVARYVNQKLKCLRSNFFSRPLEQNLKMFEIHPKFPRF